MPRTIFHVDMDAFFVSVEELADPSLIGKAVVVGGQRDERGVCSAASYEARKFGVHSAMPLRTAAKLCPHAVFLDGHPERYREASEKVFEVLTHFSPRVEMASIDEAYVDMTGTARLHGPPFAAAHALHAEMKQATRLNCSIGIGASRLVAKVASDLAKPHGILWVLEGAEAALLAPLDVRKIPGVGEKMERELAALGIRKVGDLARLDEAELDARFGKWGLALAGKARGEDAGGYFDSEVGEDEEPKSISHEHTYSTDTADLEALEATLARLSEMVGRRLREHGLHAANIALKLRYEDFSTHTRQRKLEQPTQLDPEIFSAARALFRAHWKRGRKVRLLGVRAAALSPAAGQLGLLDAGEHQRWQQALSAADRLRDRFGESAVSLARGLKSGFRERIHENPAKLPREREPRSRKKD